MDMNNSTLSLHSEYYQEIIQPLPGENPCGSSLEYDPAFIMLLSNLEPKLEAEYGSFVEAAAPINWAEIERECRTLLSKSIDIRLIITLIRCRMRKIGLFALHEGLDVLHHLLKLFPQNLYPQLEDEGEFEPLMRSNAFSELENVNGFLGDLRQQLLPKAAGQQITVKEFEKGHAFPREEGALAEITLISFMREWSVNESALIHSLKQAALVLNSIKAVLDEQLRSEGPDFLKLSHILNLFSINGTTGFADTTPAMPTHQTHTADNNNKETPTILSSEVTSENNPDTVVIFKKIESRADAQAHLREVRAWLTVAEPSNPVILLLDFADQIFGKTFAELLKILPPEIVSQLNTGQES